MLSSTAVATFAFVEAVVARVWNNIMVRGCCSRHDDSDLRSNFDFILIRLLMSTNKNLSMSAGVRKQIYLFLQEFENLENNERR